MAERMLAIIKGARWCWRELHPRWGRSKSGHTSRQRAREKDRERHEQRRESNAPAPGGLFDDNECPTHAVWLAEVENDAGLRQVDFDGTYTTVTPKRSDQ